MAATMAESVFIVPVFEAESVVASLRERFDASAKLGVPAHITVLAPFMPPDQITDAVVQRVRDALSAVPMFSYRLAEVGRFAATAFLAPEPPGPFIALTETLTRTFPAYPPYGGKFDSVVPHLTVAQGSAADVEAASAELVARMEGRRPIACRCTAVVLLGNSSGRWAHLHSFALPHDGV